jgi:hypothetical protein
MPVPDFSPGEVLTAAAMDSIGLWLVKTQTISATAVSSIIVTNAFSADYDNYLITVSNTEATGANAVYAVQMRTGSTTSTVSYNGVLGYWTYAGAAGVANNSNASSWGFVGRGTSSGDKMSFAFNLYAPFLASKTSISTQGSAGGDITGNYTGFHNVASSFDQFVITTPISTTGGTIRVYGYRN